MDSALGNQFITDALLEDGHVVTNASNWTDFNAKMLSGSFDIVIGMHNNNSTQADVTSLGNYISAGGKVIYADWERQSAIYNLFGASFTNRSNATLGNITMLDLSLAAGMANPFSLHNPGWAWWAFGLLPSGAETLARFANADAAIVKKNGANAILLGFLCDTLSDSDGKALFKNMVFILNSHLVSSSAGPNGAISPAGPTRVHHGGSQPYTITPDPGYTILDVTVDSVSIGAQSGYSFSGVSASHTIAATFARAEDVSVTPSSPTTQAGAGVTLTPTAVPGATSYVYDFGNGHTQTSASAAPLAYDYDTAGPYTVTLTAMNGSTPLSSAATTVTVNFGQVEAGPVQDAGTVVKATETLAPVTATQLQLQYGVTDTTMQPLRQASAFTATLSQPLGMAAFRISMYDTAGEVAKLRLVKLKADGTNREYAYGSSASLDRDGTWWITDEQGYDIPLASTLAPATKYWANFVIKDNGPYDADPASGQIADPVTIARSATDATAGDSGSSSGCVFVPSGRGIELPALLLGGIGLAALRRKKR